jgi:hypothetical protein
MVVFQEITSGKVYNPQPIGVCNCVGYVDLPRLIRIQQFIIVIAYENNPEYGKHHKGHHDEYKHSKNNRKFVSYFYIVKPFHIRSPFYNTFHDIPKSSQWEEDNGKIMEFMEYGISFA